MNGTVNGLRQLHGHFQLFLRVLVKFCGSITVHGFGAMNPCFLNGTVKPRFCTAVLKP